MSCILLALLSPCFPLPREVSAENGAVSISRKIQDNKRPQLRQKRLSWRKREGQILRCPRCDARNNTNNVEEPAAKRAFMRLGVGNKATTFFF